MVDTACYSSIIFFVEDASPIAKQRRRTSVDLFQKPLVGDVMMPLFFSEVGGSLDESACLPQAFEFAGGQRQHQAQNRG